MAKESQKCAAGIKECDKMKLMVFDVDGTLSEHGTAIPEEVAEQLRRYEQSGLMIGICSGKPAYYLAGLARGMGLKKAQIIGENGGVIFNAATLEESYIVNRLPVLDEIEKKAVADFKDKIWIQPNRIALTIFPKNQQEVPHLAEYIREMLTPIEKEVVMYVHVDAIDIVPVGVDKGAALKKLAKELQIEKENILAFGDSANDLPMFRESGKVVMIGQRIEYPNAVSFESIQEAFQSKTVHDFIK